MATLRAWSSCALRRSSAVAHCRELHAPGSMLKVPAEGGGPEGWAAAGREEPSQCGMQGMPGDKQKGWWQRGALSTLARNERRNPGVPSLTSRAGQARGAVCCRVAPGLAGAAGGSARDVRKAAGGARLAGRAAGCKGIAAQWADGAAQGARGGVAAGVAAREAEQRVLGCRAASGGGGQSGSQDVQDLVNRHLRGDGGAGGQRSWRERPG